MPSVPFTRYRAQSDLPLCEVRDHERSLWYETRCSIATEPLRFSSLSKISASLSIELARTYYLRHCRAYLN